jgi:hypothetical protein
VAGAVPVLVTVTVCQSLFVLTSVSSNVRLVGLSARVAVPPLVPYTSKDDSCPAGHPVFAVMLSRT